MSIKLNAQLWTDGVWSGCLSLIFQYAFLSKTDVYSITGCHRDSGQAG